MLIETKKVGIKKFYHSDYKNDSCNPNVKKFYPVKDKWGKNL